MSRRDKIKKRNADIKTKFDSLYNVKRVRFDDCIKQLSDEFYLAEDYIRNKILKIKSD